MLHLLLQIGKLRCDEMTIRHFVIIDKVDETLARKLPSVRYIADLLSN